jgi:hypothetical protein
LEIPVLVCVQQELNFIGIAAYKNSPKFALSHPYQG